MPNSPAPNPPRRRGLTGLAPAASIMRAQRPERSDPQHPVRVGHAKRPGSSRSFRRVRAAGPRVSRPTATLDARRDVVSPKRYADRTTSTPARISQREDIGATHPADDYRGLPPNPSASDDRDDARSWLRGAETAHALAGSLSPLQRSPNTRSLRRRTAAPRGDDASRRRASRSLTFRRHSATPVGASAETKALAVRASESSPGSARAGDRIHAQAIARHRRR